MQEIKKCSRCKKEKSVADFYKSKSQRGGFQAYCKDCNLRNLNERYSTLDVEKRRKGSRKTLLKSKYGLTLEQYDEMFASQGGACAICNKPETSRSNKSGPVDSLRVDHCHATNKVRGLLCSECNFGISKFDDLPSRLVGAANYLLIHKNQIPNSKHYV